MKKIRLHTAFLSAFLILSFAVAADAQSAASGANGFWAELQKLCGKAFEGSVASAPENDTTFRGKQLFMHVRQCEENRIKIPFVVGDNLSRTWILTKKGDRIELKHDHRHEDGSNDRITMYGGTSPNTGLATRQMFPADQETVNMLPRGGTNLWWIDLIPGKQYKYSVRRAESDSNISVSFDLSKEVEPPAAPWGWADSGVDQFWNELKKLCGKAFAGEIAADTDKSPAFAGKPLVMHVRSCEEDRIRIPFFVGDDKSRTWVLTKKNNRILLKHDHRHDDGTPEKVTMYGGWSTNSGESIRQFFPADQETVYVVEPPQGNAPTAAGNIWWIELVPGSHYSYNLRRLGREPSPEVGRLFTVRFDITKEIPAPAPPWGWVD